MGIGSRLIMEVEDAVTGRGHGDAQCGVGVCGVVAVEGSIAGVGCSDAEHRARVGGVVTVCETVAGVGRSNAEQRVGVRCVVAVEGPVAGVGRSQPEDRISARGAIMAVKETITGVCICESEECACVGVVAKRDEWLELPNGPADADAAKLGAAVNPRNPAPASTPPPTSSPSL